VFVAVANRGRSILHVDLDPFFVSVERSLDPTLRGKPVIIGGGGGPGVVAAASEEARAAGVRSGQSLAHALRLCPDAAARPGDLDTYARISNEVTDVLLAASRRVERPSTDEAFVDLTRETPSGRAAVPAAEAIKDELQRRLGLDAALGLASSRLAARVASTWARPRGLLVVLPGYEASFLARHPVASLPDLPPHLEAALQRAGIATLGELLAADDDTLSRAAGGAAGSLRAAAQGDGEDPVAVAAPPASIQEEASLRSRRNDHGALEAVLDGLVDRACRRMRPFALAAGSVTVEARRPEGSARRTENVAPGVSDEATLRDVVRALAAPLLEPPAGVRSLVVRLGRLATPHPQSPLFPELSGMAR
jgi:DNA polymerase-4